MSNKYYNYVRHKFLELKSIFLHYYLYRNSNLL